MQHHHMLRRKQCAVLDMVCMCLQRYGYRWTCSVHAATRGSIHPVQG